MNLKRSSRRAFGALAAAALAGAYVSTAVAALGQDDEVWFVPEQEAAIENPIEATADSLEHGREVYIEHCETCHGTTGRGDGASLQFIPGLTPRDFTRPGWGEEHSDGALYFKIATGRGQMNPYEDYVDELDDIWHTVNYIRGFTVAQADDARMPGHSTAGDDHDGGAHDAGNRESHDERGAEGIHGTESQESHAADGAESHAESSESHGDDHAVAPVASGPNGRQIWENKWALPISMCAALLIGALFAGIGASETPAPSAAGDEHH